MSFVFSPWDEVEIECARKDLAPCCPVIHLIKSSRGFPLDTTAGPLLNEERWLVRFPQAVEMVAATNKAKRICLVLISVSLQNSRRLASVTRVIESLKRGIQFRGIELWRLKAGLKRTERRIVTTYFGRF